MSNIEGYILVPPLEPRRCLGCAFFFVGGCERREKERRCNPCYSPGAQDSIYIEDTVEAKVAYTRCRLLGAKE